MTVMNKASGKNMIVGDVMHEGKHYVVNRIERVIQDNTMSIEDMMKEQTMLIEKLGGWENVRHLRAALGWEDDR